MTAFLLVAIVVVVAPGPDFALTLRNTMARGRRAGVATASGVVCGQLVWEVATVAGLAALLVASRPAFVALRLAGAAYLVWLGLVALHAAWRNRQPGARGTLCGSPYRQGLLSNLGNPKMAVFFTSLLPQFGASSAELAVHALLFSALTLGWLCLVARAGAARRVPVVRRLIDAVAGVVLVAFGARLASGRR
ncbi:MAG TPA: LysE family translocator [Gaiellaceae bacterium]|nr:LysE family translocator [Gaiellaceae bacterium]